MRPFRFAVVALGAALSFALSGALPFAAPLSAQIGADGKFGVTDTTGAVYRTAIARLKPVVTANATDAASRRELVRALSEIGEYAEAERIAGAGGTSFLRTTGDVQLSQGKIDAALGSYQRAVDAHAPDSASARLGVA
jgi:hypothetical protein